MSDAPASGAFQRVIDVSRAYLPITVTVAIVAVVAGVLFALVGIRDDVEDHIVRIERVQERTNAQLEQVVVEVRRNQESIARVTQLAREVVEGRLDTLERRQDVMYERLRNLEARLAVP